MGQSDGYGLLLADVGGGGGGMWLSAPEGAPPEGAEPRLSCWDFTTAPVRASMSYSYSLPLA